MNEVNGNQTSSKEEKQKYEKEHDNSQNYFRMNKDKLKKKENAINEQKDKKEEIYT